MVRIFIHPDTSRSEIEVEAGVSVMQGAVAKGVQGIVAECGGSAMCATCHVYVDERFVVQLPEQTDEEDELLDCTASPRQSCSRLSCQLRVTADLDSSCSPCRPSKYHGYSPRRG